jgi:hypothetical protein
MNSCLLLISQQELSVVVIATGLSGHAKCMVGIGFSAVEPLENFI